jgi:hypothetical protein
VFEKGQQEVLNQHLQTIEATFVKCDEVLSDVRASVASAPASSGTALAAPQQELGALRGHVDTLAVVIQATAVQVKDAEDAAVLDRVKMNELTAWCNNSDQRHSAKVASQDATLRTELMTTFKMVRTEFDTLRAGLCKCPNGCAGREPQQASQEPDRFSLTPGVNAEPSPARLPFLKKGLWTSPGGDGGPPGGGGGGGDDGDGDDWGDDDDEHRRGPRGPKPHRALTRESKNPFDCKEKGDVEKYNGKDNKLWRKKTTNFLAAKFPDVHPLLIWAEKQAEEITDEKIAGGCFADHDLQAAKLTAEYASTISFHLWGFLNTKLVEDAWGLFDSAKMWAGLEVWRLINMDVTQLTQAEIMNLEDAVR